MTLHSAPDKEEQASERAWHLGGANRARWRPDGVLEVVLGDERHSEGLIYDEQDGRDALELVTGLIGDRQNVHLLVDIRGLSRTSAGARRIPSHPEVCCLAFWVSGPVGRMLGNAYLGIVKPEHPTRLFSEEALAITWLKSQGHLTQRTLP